jgi:flagellar biosynthesis GTPase FlhF
MPETRTYQGASLEELLPQIRADLGAGAVITRRREGVTGGFAGFFGKRCVEIEAQAGGPVPAIPARTVFDAYDSAREPDDDGGPVMRSLSTFEDLDIVSANGAAGMATRHVLAAGWDEVAAGLVGAGMPEAVVEALVDDAARMLSPFDPEASPAELVRRMLARTMRVEHGWRTKSRTIALVGPAGSGKTLTAAKLAHAYAGRSPFTVRTLSLEPGEGADRLATMTEGLDIERRSADTPDAAKTAVRAPGADGVIIVDTPPVSAGDPDGIAALGRLLTAVRPDETHLVTPAGYDARSLLHLNAALDATCPVNRILISRIDEAPSAAVAVGISLQLKRPVSYLCDGRRPADGLRPADPVELASLVMP